MPLVVLCGLPSCGKSTIARKLEQVFTAAGAEVDVIDEPSLHLSKNEAYKDSASEKRARGTIKSHAERCMSRNRILILDSLNNIKVHVDSPVERCREWNQARDDEKYEDEVFEDLARRLETPDSRNRWDSPLFRVQPGAADEQQMVDGVVSAMLGHTTPASLASGGAVSRELAPTCATTNPGLSGTNVLYELDMAAQSVISAISDAQASAGSGVAAGVVELDDGQLSFHLAKTLSPPELRRLKRDFLKLATQMAFSRLQDTHAAKRMFVEYLLERLPSI